MPLVMASDVLPELISRIRSGGSGGMGSAVPNGPLSVVVLGVGGRPLGLVVEDVLDVVEAPGELRQLGARTGVVGTVVVQERVTEVLDLEWIGTRALGAA
jgi:two-component system chemotaxis sensor kinase CheA